MTNITPRLQLVLETRGKHDYVVELNHSYTPIFSWLLWHLMTVDCGWTMTFVQGEVGTDDLVSRRPRRSMSALSGRFKSHVVSVIFTFVRTWGAKFQMRHLELANPSSNCSISWCILVHLGATWCHIAMAWHMPSTHPPLAPRQLC